MSFLKSKHSGWTHELKRTPFGGGGGGGGFDPISAISDAVSSGFSDLGLGGSLNNYIVPAAGLGLAAFTGGASLGLDAASAAADAASGAISVGDALSAGATASDLFNAGVSTSDLVAAGTSASDLVAAGVPASQLISAGVPASDLLSAGVSADQLAQAGVSAEQLASAGASAQQLATATPYLEQAAAGGTGLTAGATGAAGGINLPSVSALQSQAGLGLGAAGAGGGTGALSQLLGGAGTASQIVGGLGALSKLAGGAAQIAGGTQLLTGAKVPPQQAAPFSQYQPQLAAQLFNLLQNPSTITSTPGYQFNLQQGLQAQQAQQAAQGSLVSGGALEQAQAFGQQYATSQLANQQNLLASVTGAAYNPATAAAAQQQIGATNVGSTLGGLSAIASGAGGVLNPLATLYANYNSGSPSIT